VPSVARWGMLGSRSHRVQRGHRIGEAEVRFGSKAEELMLSK
jgi:hypothetical protein